MAKREGTLTRAKHVYGFSGAHIRVMPDNTVWFYYWLEGEEEEDGSGEFSLLSEVGEPYRAKFDRIIQEYNFVFASKPKELNHYPYYADQVVSVQGVTL